MPPVDVNYVAVLAAAVANMAIGFAWYSMSVFGKPWMRMSGLKEADIKQGQKEMGPKYAIMVIAALVMAYVLSHIIDFAQANTIAEGLSTSFWVWLGFVATVGINAYIFEKKPIELYCINVGYYLVALLVQGAILAVWV